MKDVGFYRAFEDHFRGSRELVKSRLRVYLPFVLPLKTIYEECEIVDLGCGRGEWLELIVENGFGAQGVDLDDGMIATCHANELPVAKGDAVLHLQKLQDESVAVVSGFHIIEHIPFDALRTLISEAHRVLKPGGLLILETPNPENLLVGTSSFYLDPTHRRPVPAPLLYFLAEYYGYARNKILRLQESPSLSYTENVRVWEIFVGVSPDYAIVAQKSAPKEHLSLFDAAFSKEYGLTMDDLAMRYEKKSQEQLAYERNRWQWLEGEWNAAKARIEDLNGQINHWRALADSSNRELQSVYASRSWRITGPLRFALNLYIGFNDSLLNTMHVINSRIKGLINFVMVRLIRFAMDHPALKACAMPIMRKIPALNTWMRRFVPSMGSGVEHYMSSYVPLRLQDLSPQARHIHADLMAAIEKNRRSH